MLGGAVSGVSPVHGGNVRRTKGARTNLPIPTLTTSCINTIIPANEKSRICKYAVIGEGVATKDARDASQYVE